MLDKRKPYSSVRGLTPDRCRFIQDGVRYLNDGTPIKQDAKPVAKPAPTPAPAPLVEEDVPAESEVALADLHHMKLKVMMKEHGREYVDRASAVAFLESVDDVS